LASDLVKLFHQHDPTGAIDGPRERSILISVTLLIEDHVEDDDRRTGFSQALDEARVEATGPFPDGVGIAEALAGFAIQADHHDVSWRGNGTAQPEQPAEPQPVLERSAERCQGQEGADARRRHTGPHSLRQPTHGCCRRARRRWIIAYSVASPSNAEFQSA
jgi:hypothetical protein